VLTQGGPAGPMRRVEPGVPFVFDVDGTVCFDGRTIAPDIVGAIKCCRQSHPIVFASARPIRDLMPTLPDGLTDVNLIGANGALTRMGDRTKVTKFTAELRRIIDDLVDRYELEYLIDSSWDYSYQVKQQRDILGRLDLAGLATRVDRETLAEYVKVTLFGVPDIALKELAEADLTIHRQRGDLVDLWPATADKALALAALSISGGEYVAFGNDQNDIKLFQGARFSVCVGNSDAGRHADLVVTRAEVSAVISALVSDAVDTSRQPSGPAVE
jgi:HAD superfamily hydrolase (TIGR01484 family)